MLVHQRVVTVVLIHSELLIVAWVALANFLATAARERVGHPSFFPPDPMTYYVHHYMPKKLSL